jgi:hypothetical protein
MKLRFLVLLAVAAVLALSLLAQMRDASPRQTGSLLDLESPNRVLSVTIQDNQLVGGRTIQAQQDDRLLLKIRSNNSNQFHVEGYHAFASLQPGREVDLQIWTATAGVFPIRLDDTKQVIGELVVTSRP